jgi:uncharacterized protein
MTYVGIIIAAYVGLLALMYFTQRSLMYHPGKEMASPMVSGVPEMVAINLKNDEGMKIVSWYKASSTNKPTLVYFQGNAGTIADRNHKVRPFIDHGIGVILVGYRGYGNNPGSPTEEGLYADAATALEFLSRTGIKPNHWILYGESLGTGIAVEMAKRYGADTPAAALILEAPFTSMVDAGKSHYSWLPVNMLLKDRYDSLSKINSINVPLLIIHGTDDNVVPMTLGQKLFNAAVEPKQAHWINNAAHNDLFDHDGGRLSIEFIDQIWARHNF